MTTPLFDLVIDHFMRVLMTRYRGQRNLCYAKKKRKYRKWEEKKGPIEKVPTTTTPRHQRAHETRHDEVRNRGRHTSSYLVIPRHTSSYLVINPSSCCWPPFYTLQACVSMGSSIMPIDERPCGPVRSSHAHAGGNVAPGSLLPKAGCHTSKGRRHRG